LHFECRGAPARVRVWRCEGRPPLPHHFVCVEKFTLPYLTKDRALSKKVPLCLAPARPAPVFVRIPSYRNLCWSVQSERNLLFY